MQTTKWHNGAFSFKFLWWFLDVDESISHQSKMTQRHIGVRTFTGLDVNDKKIQLTNSGQIYFVFRFAIDFKDFFGIKIVNIGEPHSDLFTCLNTPLS